ncbi:MAG: FimV/HubP family polar landmark protein [Rudaea sp.]|uniref:FimV/HubP family polar landmark protein n=1 Tax=Rudaea sp. TaxID=2136325 RepID=UPI0039E48AC1
MKGPIKSALSIALGMAASQAFALGLGPIQIKSGLNQPLLAEIPVVTDTATEADDLHVDLASAEDFQRVGLSRARVTVPIEFTVANSGHGKVIRLTTKEAVREPFLDFLIEAIWSKGKLLREYTVLLDPPVTAPAVLATAPGAAEKPKPVEAAPRAPVNQPRAVEAPRPATPAAPAAASPRAAAKAEQSGEYTVQRGDTLSQIANERVDDERDFNRMLLALYKANPGAFAGNINVLKTGAVLRIPSAAEVQATGTLREAAMAVRAQNEAWRGGAATVVANTGAAPAADKSAAPANAEAASRSERLALVPPSGADSDGGASRGGAGGGKSTALHADLARTKEALSNREQETNELKSRVSQLEDINEKSQRLISLKDSQIAELQNKLKQLEAGKAGTKPADTATVEPAVPPVASAPASAAAVPAPAPAAAMPTPPPAVSQPPSTQPAETAAASTPAPTPVPAPAVVPKPAPASVSPAAPKPWYVGLYEDNPYALYGVGGILVLLAGWLLARASGKKKKVNPRPMLPAASAAAVAVEGEDALGEEEAGHHSAEAAGDAPSEPFETMPLVGDDEMEELHRHFDDGDADRFLALAHALREKLPEDSTEWHEVSELGRQLLPDNPLFADSAQAAHDGHDPDEFFLETDSGVEYAEPIDEASIHDAQLRSMLDEEGPLAFEQPHHEPAPESNEPSHLEFEREFSRQVDAVPDGLAGDDEIVEGRHTFLDEDTISTRLDLARAYLDMGDPDGARSMLDEVLAEGNPAQKEEARKLLSEIG